MSAASTTADLEATTVPSDPIRPLPRRAMFAVSGTAVLAAAAACSSGTTATGTTTAPSSPATSSARTSGSSPATSASNPVASTAVDQTPPASASEAAPGGTPVASVADVQAAGSLVVEGSAGPLLLAFTDGTVVAHTAVCTHQQCTIAASGMCPCHGSKFDVTTGAVENGPALRPLAQENVMVSGGQVYLT